MRSAIDEYLDLVLSHASLAKQDEKRVRAELADHLHELVTAAANERKTQPEIFAMLEQEFGSPSTIGTEIGGAKGKFRTYIKKQRRRLPMAIACAVVLVLTVRMTVAAPYYTASDAVAPAIAPGSRMIVYKLTSSFSPNDVVLFKNTNGLEYLGIVKTVSEQKLTLSRNGEPDQDINTAAIVGRVVLCTR